MTDTWDGRPQSPERNGWHWLMQDALLYPARWDAAASAWHRSRFLTPAEIARLNDYCGPCLTPADVEAEKILAREEGRIAGFEEAMDDLRDAPPLGVNRHGVMYLSPAEVEARVAAARREGIEAALAAVNAEPEPEGDMPAKLANTDKRILVIATVRATKRGIDGRIRALLTEDER